MGYGRLGIEIPVIAVAETAVAHGSVSEAGRGIAVSLISVVSAVIIAVVSSEVRVALLFCQFLVGKSSLFFLFLLFQGFYHLVNGDIPFCFAHAGKRLQGVLQMDGVSIRHQFIEYLRTVGELFVVFAVLV